MKERIKKVINVLLIVLQSTLLIGQEQVGGSREKEREYEITYTISVAGEETVKKDIGITRKNGKTRITRGFIPSEGYSAFFVGEDGKYYKYEYREGTDVWEEITEKPEKEKFKRLYKKLENRNVIFTTEEEENMLTDTSYVEVEESELEKISDAANPRYIRSKDNGYDNLYVYNKSKGVFVYVVKKPNTTKAEIICFRDKKTIVEIKPEGMTEEDFYKGFEDWLELKTEDENVNEYKKLTEMVYVTLQKAKNEGHIENLYDNDSNMFIRKYLHLGMKNHRNVYYYSEEDKKGMIAEDYELITDKEGERITAAAKSYLGDSVDAKKKTIWKIVIEELAEIIEWITRNPEKSTEEYFEQENKNGVYLPYREKGYDTPNTYNEKLIKDKTAEGGSDDIGFLNGILYKAEIKTYVPQKESLKEIYEEYTKAILEGKVLEKREKLISFQDINNISVIVSDVTEAQAGDIVIFEREEKKKDGKNVSKKFENKKVGIIVEDIESKAEEYGTNQKKLLGEIKVVWMNEEKGAEETKLSEIWKREEGYEVPRYVEIRRILKKGNSRNANTDWDVYKNNRVSEAEVEINWMKEEGQKSGEKHRWIPNTGEYLSLEKIRLRIRTELGIPVRGGDWKVRLTGARDRGWELGKETEGNIYNNSEGEFEIKVGEATGILRKNESDKSRYDIEWKENENGEEVFTIGTDGILFMRGEGETLRPAEIKIRPRGAKKGEEGEEEVKGANPGDDLLLEFSIKEEEKEEIKEVRVSSKDYIAVYDKKMIWRANLFIAEGEEVLSGEDWNDAHTWNAPTSGEKDEKEWYGKNEWNRRYDLNQEATKEIKTLPEGDGGQVVNFTSWTALRGMLENNEKVAKNYSDRVAYDYPQPKTKEGKYINAWDSPFDFVYKMKLQREGIREHEYETYEEEKGEEEVAAEEKIVKFTNEDKTEIESEGTIREHEYETYEEEEGEEEVAAKKKIVKFTNEDKTEIKSEGTITVGALKGWNVTTAPYGKWRYYQREGEKGFVPGIGLFLHASSHSYNDVIYDAKKEGSVKIEMINRKSAGTDCVGFAERTASYDGNKYKWEDLPEGWIEGVDPDKEVRLSYYPQNQNASNIILSKEKIGTLNSHFTDNYVPDNDDDLTKLSESEFKKFRAQFEKVIPGDVITYKNEEKKYAHIGVITDVNYEGIEEAQSIVSIMDNIQVIESNFGSYINYVKKGMSTDGIEASYDDNTYIVGSWFYGWIDKAPPKIRNFQIERLIIEEKN